MISSGEQTFIVIQEETDGAPLKMRQPIAIAVLAVVAPFSCTG
jgi:hypothetical protein